MKSTERLELHTLGGLRLTREHTPVGGAGARRKSLALLAILASANSRGVSRDKITALLWPEADADSARTVLRQTLYSLRRDLDSDLVLGTVELRLNSEVIESDLARFDDALRRNDRRAAVELYNGPFLDGLYLREAPDFDRWVEDERARRAYQFRSALEDLATSATDRADWREAIQRWQRLVRESPTDTRIATQLMQAIASSGDRAAALEYARKHATHLEEELGVHPDPAFHAAAARIRDTASTIRTEADTKHERGPVAGTLPAASIVALPEPNEHADSRRRARSMLGAALLAVVGGVVWVGVRNGRGDGETSRSVESLPIVAILPFSVDGSPEHAYLSEGIPKLLGAGLDGTDILRSADERAVRAALGIRSGDAVSDAVADSIARLLGAAHYVRGDVVFASGRVRIVARLHDTSAPNPVIREAEGDTSQVFELVDELTRELAGAQLTEPSNRLAAVASVTTTSLSAFKAFLEGEREMRAFRYAAAVAAFRRAVALDSTFALAFHRLSEAADWNGMPALVDSASRQAVAYAERLTDRERRLLDGVRAWRSGDTDRSEAILERLVRDYPLDVEAWYHLGEVRFHSAPLRGRPLEASVVPFERTLELQPDHRAALMHLQRALARNGRHAESDALGLRLQRVLGDTGISTLNLLTVYAAGPDSQRASLLRAASTWPLGSLWDATTQSAVFSRNLQWSNRLARLFTARALSVADRRQGILAIALTEAAQGRFQDAEKVLASSTEVSPAMWTGARAALALMPFADSTLGIDHLRSLCASLSQWMRTDAPHDSVLVASPTQEWLGAYAHGLLSARLGDVNAARRSAELLVRPNTRRRTRELSTIFSRSIHAELARRAGRREEALRFLVDSQPPVSLELQPTFYGSLAHERWMRAELLQELGRLDEALTWYESLAETSINEIPYLAPSHLRRAQIYERQRVPHRAAHHYARFAELWASADAPLQTLVEDARRRAGKQHVATGSKDRR